MGVMASQINSLTIVYSTVYSGADQRKHQSGASLAFVRGIHRSPVNSPHKGPVTRKMFPFDDVIMTLPEYEYLITHPNCSCLRNSPAIAIFSFTHHDLGPLLLTWFDINPSWIRNYIHFEVWNEITYPFPEFNGYTMEWILLCERLRISRIFFVSAFLIWISRL